MELVPGVRSFIEAAVTIQQHLTAAGVGRPTGGSSESSKDWLSHLEDTITSESILAASRSLFADGHYARAVEEAYKCLNNAVKEKSGLSSLDGDALMRKTFSAENPVLRLNRLRSRSEKDEQRGYMDLFAGAITGIRNPRAHEYEIQDDPESAVEMLSLANHLMKRLEASTRTRRRKVT